MSVQAVLLDLLMATMDSMAVWAAAAGQRGLEWRDAVTSRMVAAPAYVPYEELVAQEARRLGLPAGSTTLLFRAWRHIEPWPDVQAVAGLELPIGFLTNCSTRLARLAARRSGLRARVVLSAQEAGWYKPDRRSYLAACRQLGSAPEDTLFVAGAAYDAAGARDAGLRACLVRRRDDTTVPVGVAQVDSLAEALGGPIGPIARLPGC